ncbi:MAG TPA: hypothetical protein VMT90_08785 [Dehalococcoidia bacterium]|nr:hypothetical protein [Dehalococcoidia bacterium]
MPFIVFSLLAIVQTWPLILHLSDGTMESPKQSGDTWAFLWDLWWVKKASLSLRNPFHTGWLLFPQGSDLYLHALVPVNGVLSIPLQLATGDLALSWNVLTLVFLVLSALGMYALVQRLTGNRAAATISAYIFAFSPLTMMYLSGSQWNVSTTWPLPLFALFLLRFWESGRPLDAVGCSIAWALLTYNYLEFGIDGGWFLAIFLAYQSFVCMKKADWTALSLAWRKCAVVSSLWLLLSLPLIIGALHDVYGQHVPLESGGEFWSNDLLTFVKPSPMWGPGQFPVDPGGPHLAAGTILGTAYLGITPLLLAVIALCSVRRADDKAIFWGAVFIFFAILSLGPYLYVGDNRSFSIMGVSFSVPLPTQIIDHIPILGDRRIASRTIVIGAFGFSVLAGLGCHVLMSSIKRRAQALVPWVALIVFFLVVLEYWNPPVFVSHVSTSPALEAIHDEPGDFNVLDVPFGRGTGITAAGDSFGAAITDYYQTVHGKPSLGGYLARVESTTLAWVSTQPGLKYLACKTCEQPSEDDLDATRAREVFQRYKIRYVLLHKRAPDGWDVGINLGWDAYLKNVAGFTVTYDDTTLTVYRNDGIE